eukprot:TRINITY_DN9998_c0_g4_i1.p1 TRINITY_DN9998_c0_g4~~TRINITY_DN9998_c0_g4_i1.p1  ORF type:complete len:220 (+),score=10.21 TRINITY_DN9998_c0_g4_i1:52-711(+)
MDALIRYGFAATVIMASVLNTTIGQTSFSGVLSTLGVGVSSSACGRSCLDEGMVIRIAKRLIGSAEYRNVGGDQSCGGCARCRHSNGAFGYQLATARSLSSNASLGTQTRFLASYPKAFNWSSRARGFFSKRGISHSRCEICRTVQMFQRPLSRKQASDSEVIESRIAEEEFSPRSAYEAVVEKAVAQKPDIHRVTGNGTAIGQDASAKCRLARSSWSA